MRSSRGGIRKKLFDGEKLSKKIKKNTWNLKFDSIGCTCAVKVATRSDTKPTKADS